MRIVTELYWSGLQHEVDDYGKTCHFCQVCGKANEKIPWVPLQSNQCSTTGVTKAVVCAILSVGWCI